MNPCLEHREVKPFFNSVRTVFYKSEQMSRRLA
jgi:hypothetical protein